MHVVTRDIMVIGNNDDIWMSKVILSVECSTTCTWWPLGLISPSRLSPDDEPRVSLVLKNRQFLSSYVQKRHFDASFFFQSGFFTRHFS